MKFQAIIALSVIGLAVAGPLPQDTPHRLRAREVPQEHSHNVFLDLCRTALNLNNPKGIKDVVFGLLGNAAAAGGAGSVTNLDCLQQETADQAFSNAKAIGDIPGMAGALLYRAVERNTGKVGLASVICNETAVNPEVAAISQHQDPASPNAASINKAIVLELAKQLALIGADPNLALETGTFAPGNLNDNTGKGNSCDTDPNEPGCIFTEPLLVLDASVEEISSAVAGITPTFTGTGVLQATHINFAGLPIAGGGTADAGAAQTNNAAATTATEAAATTAQAGDAECTPSTVFVTATAAAAAAASSCSVITTTVAASVASSMLAAAPQTNVAAAPAATAATGTTNVQKFAGAIGAPPPPIESSAGPRPFSVNGDTFVNLAAAAQRSCDVQKNACFNAANSGALQGGTAQCETQHDDCTKANLAPASRTKFRRAADFGTCGAPNVVFKSGLDGRTEEAFIAVDQTDYQHGSAQKIGIIAGFICDRLGSSCKAPPEVVASCTAASAAAVATTQNQAAADVFNAMMGVGGGAAAPTAAPVATAAGKAGGKAGGKSVVMTITQCA